LSREGKRDFSRLMSKKQVDPRLPSLAAIPATDESRQELEAAGLSAFQDQQPITEVEAQTLLESNSISAETVEHAPRCFGGEYDPTTMLCGGCVFAPRCWQIDDGYLARLKAGETLYPLGAPRIVVDTLLEALEPVKEKKRKRARPPKT